MKSVGGNGLINFKYNVMATKSSYLMSVTGMAIRMDESLAPSENLPIVEQPKTDIYVDGIHCFIFKRFQSGVVVMTDDILTVNQVKVVYKEFALRKKECQFFLPKTKLPYMAITDNGYIVDYKTNEFIGFVK